MEDYHIAKFLLDATRVKELMSTYNNHNKFHHKTSNQQDLRKTVLTKQCLITIQKHYPITSKMTLDPRFSKQDILNTVKCNKNTACVEMLVVYNIDISEFINKL